MATPRSLDEVDLASVRLAAFDVDGTCLTSDHRITPRLVEALHALRATGLQVVFATSRGPSVLKPVLEQLGVVDDVFFVASQGALAGSYGTDGALRVEEQSPAPLEQSREFSRDAAEAGLTVSWYSGDHWYCTGVDAAIEREAEIVGVQPEFFELQTATVPPDKVLVVAAGDQLDLLHEVAARLPEGLMAQTSHPNYLEVTATGVDKAASLQRLCERHGVDSAHLLAMGDGNNDVTMLRLAGIAVVPANGSPRARAEADALVPSNDDFGAATVMEALAKARTRS